MSSIVLNNSNSCDAVKSFMPNLYYPRLQVNDRGEIVLSIERTGSLTKGICVGKTKESKSDLPIGQRLDDWEVCGELSDYDGEITVSIKNRFVKV